ncbi:hypothetical protein [Variovorax sp. LT1R16]
MNLLRDPIPHLRSSPHGSAAAVLDATSGRSLRFPRTFDFLCLLWSHR